MPPDDPAALAEAIEYLATHSERAAAMGAKGRAWCEQHYTIGRYAADLHRFFESL